MTCQQAFELLNDYVDGTLDEAQHQELELHLAGCSGCRKEERALRAFLAEAVSHKRETPPPRDLWPAIAERIERQQRILPFLRPGSALRRYAPPLVAVAAAAAIALVSHMNVGPKPVETAPSGTLQQASTSASSDVERAEREYERATSQLIAALNAKRAGMSPEAQKTLDDNIAAIDGGLREVRAALQKDPQNAKLTRMLAATHQKKLDLLLRLIRLTSQI
jgi:anti-sigma factor RsiW